MCYAGVVLKLISAPATNERGPRYMEKALAAIHQANYERQPMSLEYGLHEGRVALFVRSLQSLENLVIGPIAANYPNCSITTIEADTPPLHDWETWAAELELVPELFPILRHSQFEDMLNHIFADPVTPTTSGTEERNAITKLSRTDLIAIANLHPINLDLVDEYGDFPNRKAAAAWLNRQKASGNLKCVGLMKDPNGRKVVDVFCNGWTPKDDNLRHETIGTRIRLLYPAFHFTRGYKLSECYEDMRMTNAEHRFEIEIDCGTLKHKQVTWR